jgi:hypothetical protein
MRDDCDVALLFSVTGSSGWNHGKFVALIVAFF